MSARVETPNEGVPSEGGSEPASPGTRPADNPPVAERKPVELTAHGDTRIDDWFWLRDIDDPAVSKLLDAENAHTAASTTHLEALAERVYEDMLSSIQLTDVSYPAPKGDWAYYVRTIEGAEHPVSCRRPVGTPLPSADPAAGDEHEKILLDENAMAAGHDYFGIGSTALSLDQRLLAYTVDTDGSERMTLRIRDLETGEDLPDVVENVYYGLAFAGGDTIFYTRPDEAMRPGQIWQHAVGTGADADVLVWDEPDEHFFLGVTSSKDGEYVLLGARSSITAEVRLVSTVAPSAPPVVVEPRQHGVIYSVEHLDGELLVLSNQAAENFALYRTSVASPARPYWRLLLPHREDVRLESIDVVDGHVIVEERGHATTAIRVLPLGAAAAEASGDGVLPGRLVEAPPAGYLGLERNLDVHASEVRFETASLITPLSLQTLDLVSGSTKLLHRQPAPGYDPDRYITERHWAPSADGTLVPLTLAWRKDRPTGPGPCLLYGYGAYELSSDPIFRVDRPIHPLLDRGVVYVIAHIRGGGELGRHWYLDGKLAKKPHTFEDFVAVARYLVREGWTTPAQLAALGGSAGGLLMGASVNIAPELFAAVVAEVPFVDCLTTMLDPSLPLTVIEQEEWGDPAASLEDYDVIKSYSPYDNVRGELYPKMLVRGGLHDSRVGFFEPAKWVQKLRASHTDNARPGRILLHMDLSAGHGGPSGRYQRWRKRAFMMAFVLDAIDATDATDEAGRPAQPEKMRL